MEYSGALTAEVVDTYSKIKRTTIDPVRARVRDILARVLQSDANLAFTQVYDVIVEFERSHELSKAKTVKDLRGWSSEDVSFNWTTLLDNPLGLDLSSVTDTASHILGRTPEQLCAEIPPQFRILHIESVIRPDLTQAFLLYRDSLHDRMRHEPLVALRRKLPPHSSHSGHVLSNARREDVIRDLLEPRVTYHGTPLRNVASIVRHGFRLPGMMVDGKVVASPRTGVVYERGIYASQAPHYALSYASGQMQKTPLGKIPGMRLFICATVMGRTHGTDNIRRASDIHGPLREGFDAHFDGGFEYIAFNERAMLPCYVIHLDLGAEAAQKALREAQEDPTLFEEIRQKSKRHRNLDQVVLAPGDVQREKQVKKAAALKWFPYGFGSASGTNFVIEDIGETSDDEETYGEWQEARHAYIRDDGLEDDRNDDYWFSEMNDDGKLVKKKKGGPMDQYQGARKAPAAS